jgi:hypothetical protein
MPPPKKGKGTSSHCLLRWPAAPKEKVFRVRCASASRVACPLSTHLPTKNHSTSSPEARCVFFTLGRLFLTLTRAAGLLKYFG